MNAIINKDYLDWLKELKNKVRNVQIKSAMKVNSEILSFYWDLGADIVLRQKNSNWGDGIIKQLSKDLSDEFPEMKGFSKRNLEQIRKWYKYWAEEPEIAKQLATQIPWWHNVIIISKVQTVNEAQYYIKKTIENNWSRSVLTHQIETGLLNEKLKQLRIFKIHYRKLSLI